MTHTTESDKPDFYYGNRAAVYDEAHGDPELIDLIEQRETVYGTLALEEMVGDDGMDGLDRRWELRHSLNSLHHAIEDQKRQKGIWPPEE